MQFTYDTYDRATSNRHMALTDWLQDRGQRISETWDTAFQRLSGRFVGASIETPDDLVVHANGTVYDTPKNVITDASTKRRLEYMWFEVTETEAGQVYHGFRAIRLLMLTYIPLNARGDAGALAKMRTVLRGLYNANVELVYLVAGIYTPKPLGIVQFYGVVGRGETLADAAREAQRGAQSVEAAMAAAYPQIRFAPPSSDIAEWVRDALVDMPHTLLAVGHPDPRENARGSMTDLTPMLTMGGGKQQEFTIQQNEIVMRGMAQLQEDFLLQVILSPVSMQDAAQMLAGLAEYTSTWAAWQSGSRSFNIGTSLPLMLTGAVARNAGTGYTHSEGRSAADAVSQSHSQSHTDTAGQAHTEGISHSRGTTVTETHSHSETQSQSVVRGEGHSVTDSRMSSRSVTDGVNQGVSRSKGQSSFQSSSDGVGGNLGVPGVASVNYQHGWARGGGQSSSVTQSSGQSHAVTQGESAGHAETHSTFKSESEGHSVTDGYSKAVSRSSVTTQSASDTTSESHSDGVTDTQGRSHSEGRSSGDAAARGFSKGLSQGIAVGLAPSASLGESNMWQFDPAIVLTGVLRQQQNILNTVTLEGGFYTDVYALARTERGKQALMALIPEAFHGTEDVVMGVQVRTLTPEEDRYIRHHAMALVPSTREIRIPEAMTGYADSTLLTVLQASAYMAPGMFEEGMARTMQERIPPMAFDPDMRGEVSLGLQYSTERGELTSAQLRLTRERHFHTAFIGDTGSGKSVAAERMAYETTKAWKFRTIVLDFGQGWRKALNWPGMKGRVDIRQLHPGAVRPIRWNPLQVPKRLQPIAYRNMVAELFANAGRMGPRQLGLMRDALTRVYALTGVLIPDEHQLAEIFSDKVSGKSVSENERLRFLAELKTWQFVRDDEEAAAIAEAARERGMQPRSTRGLSVLDLRPYERQALFVFRSHKAGMSRWVNVLRGLMRRFVRDPNTQSSLRGVLLRLETMAEGEMRLMYGPGYDTLAIEDMGLLGPDDDRWGVTVIEGGAEMDEFSKASLLALASRILYKDAVVRRRESLSGRRFPPMQIFFEEANKILTGVDIGVTSDNGGQASTSQGFLDMWRDGRKYKIFLHLLAQTISDIPTGILSSCNNAFFGQTKEDKDRKALLAHLARNTSGFVNSDYDRLLARLPVAMAVAKLGYTQEIADMEPYLVRPYLLDAEEPSDEVIAATFNH